MKLFFRDFLRQLRLTEFRLLGVALILVSVAITSVSMFSDRVEQGMQARTSAIFGADALVESTRPVRDEIIELAAQFDLQVAQSVSFVSMLGSPEGSQLVGVRAVTDGYPLRGELLLRDSGNPDSNEIATDIPKPRRVWVASQLAVSLDLGKSESTLGKLSFVPDREIMLEPEGGAGMLRLAPRVMMNMSDLASTGLITPASRARFRLMLAGDSDQIAAFGNSVEPTLKSYESWIIADIRQSDVRGTIGRVVSYLRLAVLLSVVLAVVAMALAAQGLWRRQSNEVALLRCLGKSHASIVTNYLWIYLVSAIPVALIGIIFGYVAQNMAVNVVTQASGIELPGISLTPLLLVFAVSILAMLAVTLPLLLSLKGVSSIEVLRSRQGDVVGRNRVAVLGVVSLIVCVAFILARDAELAGIVVVGLSIAGLLLWSVLKLLIYAAGKIIKPRSSSIYYALKAISANSSRSAWLACAFGTTVFALVLLGVVCADLFAAWERSVPQDAPNVFLINIQEPDVEEIQKKISQLGAQTTPLFPIIRGRIISLNGQGINADELEDKSAQHRVNHEFNLTELADLPVANTITAGRWFSADESGWSVEEDTAKLLGIEIGDLLGVDIGGLKLEANVTSLRAVRWDTMRPNFFVIGSPGLLEGAPRHYITSVQVNKNINLFINDISRSFSNVSAINLDMLLQRFRSLANQASGAVGAVFVFTLGAALLVLVGVLQGQRSVRLREIALYKTLGARKRRIRRNVLCEFALLGGLSGALGGGLAILSGWILADRIFGFIYHPPWHWLVLTIIGTATLVALCGYASLRKLLDVLPIRLLARL